MQTFEQTANFTDIVILSVLADMPVVQEIHLEELERLQAINC